MPRPLRHALTLLMLGLVPLAVLSAGCKMEEKVVRSSWDALRNSAWSEDKPNSAAGRAKARNQYAVELARYEGPDVYGRVFNLIRSARQEAGLANLWYVTDGAGKTHVYAGRFRSEDSDEAKAMLSQVRRAKIGGRRPFDDAELVKITRSRERVSDPHDVRTIMGRGLYALQIGYFDRRYGVDYRLAAEKRVRALRADGKKAFYYHGPNRSLVLLNSWRRSEAFTLQDKVDRYSDMVRLVQKEFPYNVPNGKAVTKNDDPEKDKLQQSSLVAIP